MTIYYYKSYGGYCYKASGGKTKRIAEKDYRCDYEIGKTTVNIGDRVRIKIKCRGVYDAEAVGIVKRVLTSKPRHTRGKKIMLNDGTVGRVLCVFK